MRRRAVLGTVATGVTSLLAGCSWSRIEGEVVSNETPLVLSHEYATQGTPSGTRIIVTVTADNNGQEPLTPDEPVPMIDCRFLNEAGEQLHRSGHELTAELPVGEAAEFEFGLGTNTREVTRYALRAEWVEG